MRAALVQRPPPIPGRNLPLGIQLPPPSDEAMSDRADTIYSDEA